MNRFFAVSCLVLALFAAVLYRLFDLTIFQRPFLLTIATKQHNIVIPLEPRRGDILDRRGKELATTIKSPSVFANPRMIPREKVPQVARALSEILDLAQPSLEKHLSKDKAFVWIKRKVTEEQAESVLALGYPSLSIQNEHRRFYPHFHEFAHVIGFCNVDNQGLEGLELVYDAYLRGQGGLRQSKRDALGREVSALESKYIPPVNGGHLVLHVDQFIQHAVERELDKAFTKWKAKGACAIVMDPKSGHILAMANRPSFEPNDHKSSSVDSRRNRCVTDFYEPGSIFKVVTLTAALAEGKAKLEDTIFCENGTWHVSGQRVIHDVHPYGRLTVPEVLIKSSNIGTVKVAKLIGEAALYRYIKMFGFGELTGIDVKGEVAGIVHPLNRWSKISITSVPYGQEVAATAIQMLRALAVLANGGYLVRPQVVQEVRDDFGVVIREEITPVRQRILDEKLTSVMRDLLVRAVEEGTGQNAKIPRVKVAGKTGTAQKINPYGGYSHSNFISSFMGFAPAENPLLAMLVMVDDPHPSYYGGTVAAPVFKAVMEESLLYLGYTPSPDLPEKQGVIEDAKALQAQSLKAPASVPSHSPVLQKAATSQL